MNPHHLILASAHPDLTYFLIEKNVYLVVISHCIFSLDFCSLYQNGMVNAFVSFFHSFITREHDSGKLNMKLTREWTLR